jgi:hypothetical protein
MIALANVNLFLDHIARGYARQLGGDSYGTGELGDADRAAGAVADLMAAVLATADASILVGTASVPGMLTDVANWQTATSAIKQSTPRAILNRIEKQVRALGLSGVNSLDQFLTYYNYGVGGTNTALQSPYFREIFRNWKNAYPTARNLYFEVLQGGEFDGTTFANALRSLLVGTGQTAGASISTDYAGGVPYLKVLNFAGASDTVTVTGTQYDPATGTRTAGKTWTATVDDNDDFALAAGGATPASANALICAGSGIVAGASITASTLIYLEARKPSGRLAVPF